MTEIEDKIQEYRQKLSDKIATSDNLSYIDTVIPLCKELLDEIGHDPKQWPKILTFDTVDIYGECLYYHYTVNNDDEFPFELLVLLMLYRPFIYHCVCVTKTYDELSVFNDKINEVISSMYGTEFLPEYVKQFRQLMEIGDETIEDLSAITYFHYFIGFQFDTNYIGLTLNEVNRLIPQRDCLIKINICYNYHSNEVYTYHSVSGNIGNELLTPDTVKAFVPIEKHKIPTDYPEKYVSIDSPTGALGNENYAVLNYDNEHFTILTHEVDGKTEPYKFDKSTASKLMKGGLPNQISLEAYRVYAENMYYKSLNQYIAKTTIPNVKVPDESLIFEKIRPIIQEFQDKYVSKSLFTKMINRIDAKLGEMKDVPKNERKLFVFYAKCYNSDTFHVNDFIRYLDTYFLH